jgi:hypothetical protein
VIAALFEEAWNGETYKKDLGKTKHESEHAELEAQSAGAGGHESEMAGKGLA